MSWYKERKGDLRIGKLYGVGVGPGDLELLTLKAHWILDEADVIFCPEGKEGAGNFAYGIIKGLLKDAGAEIVNPVYPMHYHGDRLQEMWKENVAQITECLSGNRIEAFITLRDPTVYSTFMYTLPYIERAGVDVGVIPDITSFCAVVDSMKMPLVAWDEDLVVAPVRENSSEDLGRILKEHNNVVLMKLSAGQQALLQAIRENHLEDHFVLMTKSGTGGERLVTDFAELEQYEIPYLPTVTIKRQGR